MSEVRRKRWWQTWTGRRRAATVALVLLPLVCVFAPEPKRQSCRDIAREVREVALKVLTAPETLLVSGGEGAP